MPPVFWYNITVEKRAIIDPRKLGGFERDILEWNIPEGREIVVL